MQWMQRLDAASEQLIRAISAAIGKWQSSIGRRAQRLNALVQNQLMQHARTLERQRIKLDAISPYATLERGYSITTDEASRVIRAPEQTAVGAVLCIRVEKGSMAAVVRSTHARNEKCLSSSE